MIDSAGRPVETDLALEWLRGLWARLVRAWPWERKRARSAPECKRPDSEAANLQTPATLRAALGASREANAELRELLVAERRNVDRLEAEVGRLTEKLKRAEEARVPLGGGWHMPVKDARPHTHLQRARPINVDAYRVTRADGKPAPTTAEIVEQIKSTWRAR